MTGFAVADGRNRYGSREALTGVMFTARAGERLALIGLDPVAEAGRLSGGNRRQLNIARARSAAAPCSSRRCIYSASRRAMGWSHA
jgi:ABC-type branched-subunit amino acid transport system ATPase component